MRKKLAHIKSKMPASLLLQWKRLLLITLLLAGTVFMTSFFKRYHLPKIKKWILSEVENQSQKHSPIRIWPQNVELDFFPLGATFYDVKVLPKPEMRAALAPTTIKRIEASLSLWGIFRGELRFSRVALEDGLIELNLSKLPMPKKKPIQKPADARPGLELLDALPIERLQLTNIQLDLGEIFDDQSLRINKLNLLAENSFHTLRANVDANEIYISHRRHKSPLKGRISTEFLLDSEGLFVTEARIEHGQSEVHGTGALKGDLLSKKFDELNFKMAGHIQSEDADALKVLLPQLKNLPSTTGRVQFESDLKMSADKKYRAEYALKTENFGISHYKIGDAAVLGTIDNNTLTLTKMTAQGEYGIVRVADFKLRQNDSMKFSGQVSTDGLKLRELLMAIGLKRIPVQAHFSGVLPCEGQLHDDFTLTCRGQLNGQHLVVEGREHPIVALKNYSVSGEFNVNSKNVTYKTDLRIGESKGESTGVIDYNKGFKIDYSSPKFNFSDIDELAGLEPEGNVTLKGMTSGNSQAAIIQMQATAENLWLKDFGLGRAQTQMSYAKGKIFFKKLEGQMGRTRYAGDLTVDLNSETLEFAGTMPYVEAEDMTSAFARKVKLPFQFTGTGAADLLVNGPFDFARLSYNLHSALFRGTIAGEPYDQIHFDVTSDKGFVKSNRIEISRAASRVTAQGTVNPDGQMNLSIAGRAFQIEQFENLGRLKLSITGNLNFDAVLTKYILKPNLVFKSTITRMTVDDIPAQDSSLEFKVTEDEISGQGQFLGPSLKASFMHNQNINGNTELAVDVFNWDFTQVFSIFTDTLREGNYHTQLTAQLNLSFPNNSKDRFSGALNVKQFDVRNGQVEMKSTKPMALTAKLGVLTAQDFEISGADTFLRLKTKTDTNEPLGLTLEGRVNLALAAILTPFMDDIHGDTSFSFHVSGTYKNPQMNGSVFLDDGFFKIKGFPHSFEDVSGDANLSNGKIIINTVKGKLGGGTFQGRGQIDVIDSNSIPVDIKGEVSDTRINVPEGFFTRGDGDFFVKGNWFPYTIGVNYNVASGSIEKKSADFSKTANEIKPSVFLPKFLSAQRFTPMVLDLNVSIQKPLPVHLVINRIDIQSNVYGHMQVAGPPDRPLLNGKVTAMKGGKVTFRNNVFDIKGGYVEYNNSPPDDPTLNMQAEAVVTAQLRDNRTRDYDIDLLVQGTAKNPKLTMSSQPPLPENELISLLTLGFINEENANSAEQGEATAGEKIANTSYQLGSAFLNEQLGINRVLEKQLGLHFDFNSSYDTSDKAERHKFTLSKQWTPKFGTTASREIGKTNTNNVKAEYKLDKKLSVIGQWEGTEAAGSEQVTTSDKDLNIFGLDIEYKVDFK